MDIWNILLEIINQIFGMNYIILMMRIYVSFAEYSKNVILYLLYYGGHMCLTTTKFGCSCLGGAAAGKGS